MTSRRLKLIVAVALLVAGILFLRYLLRDAPPSEEQQLLSLVDQLASAMEEKEIKTVRQHIAASYADEGGRRADDLQRFLSLLLLRQGQVSVYVLRKQVQVAHASEPLTARLQVTTVTTRGPRVKQLADLIPEAARALQLDLELVKQDDRWQLTRAAWSDVPDWRALAR